MRVLAITLKHFRCFENKTITLEKPLTLIEGANGSGKTSLLEALTYACYLRSFRTRTPRELIAANQEAFSVKLTLECDEQVTITAGYSQTKRLVKVNDRPIVSYKHLIERYRVITITDEDITLVKGYPEGRRTFIDQAALLIKPEYARVLKNYTQVLEQRNALLASSQANNQGHMLIWNEKFNSLIETIRSIRTEIVQILEKRLDYFLATYFTVPFTVRFTYTPRLATQVLLSQEPYVRHTLYGAHLDEYSLEITSKHTTGSARSFASRGQQRLISLLLKIAQPALLDPQQCVFLLDDVISDLDEPTLAQFLKLVMSFKTQTIITSPLKNSILHDLCAPYGYERITL